MRNTLLLVLSLLAVSAGAQDGSDDVLGPDAFEDDPLGAGEAAGLDRVPTRDREGRENASGGAQAPDVPVREGEVVTAVPAVREQSHRVHVTLEDGLALGDITLRFGNVGSHPAEVRYRLPLPEDARLGAVRVCLEGRCRRGRAAPGDAGRAAYDAAVQSRGRTDIPRPVAHVERVKDGGTDALRIRAAPVPTEGVLEVRLRWLAPSSVHGGTARVTLPARGTDPRAAPAGVTVQAEDLLSPTVAGSAADAAPVSLDPWVPAEVLALQETAAEPEATVHHFPCGDHRCVRARVHAGPRKGPPRDLLLLVDASRSTRGPARGRMAPALAALLASAPEGSRVRALAFASRADVVLEDPQPVANARLRPLLVASERDLGGATRFEAAWPHVQRWLQKGRRPLVVVAGDGGLTRSDVGEAAAAAAADRGVAVHAVHVGDRDARPSLAHLVERTGGTVIHAATEAERARRGGRAAALEERLASLFVPAVLPRVELRSAGERIELGPLRAGEELVFEGRMPGRRAVLVAPGLRATSRPAPPALRRPLALRALASEGDPVPPEAWVAVEEDDLRAPPESKCGPNDSERASGIRRDAAFLLLAEARACEPEKPRPPDRFEPPDDPLAGKGIPAHTVRTLFRQRVIPAARRCLRRDRRGRADHAVRAEFVFRLAEREVIDARVEGDLTEPLRRCLLGALDELRVPSFEGVVAVRYPIHTKRAPDPPQVELEEPVEEAVEQVTDGYPSNPRRP